jgi:hypothetical protein
MLNSDVEARLAALEATVRQSKNASTRAEGYTNYRRQTDAIPFPETQTFAGNLSTTLASATGSSGTSTVTWTSVDCSSLLPVTAEYAKIYFTFVKTTGFGGTNAKLQVRRDEQGDSAAFDATAITSANGSDCFGSVEFAVPITTAGARTFQYQITGTVSGLTWTMAIRGYHTRKRNAEDSSSSGDGGSGGGGGFDTGGAGL